MPEWIAPEIAAGAMAPAGGAAPEVQTAPAPGLDRVGQLVQLATEHEAAGRLVEAERLLRLALGEAPDRPPALQLLGIVSFKQNRLAEAVSLMERSVALAPLMPVYHRNLCEAYRVVGRVDEALVAGRRAAALAPDDIHVHHNLSVLHYHRVELAEAIASAERALELDAEFAGAHFGIAEASLLGGDFARGWEEYEWRDRLANSPRLLPPTDKPQWDGRELPDGTVLLVADQGYGDVIQFSRYIGWARSRCARVVVACSAELHPVLAQQPGVDQLFDHWDRAPDFAAYCALSGLPRLAGTDLDSIPCDGPYLRADPERAAAWARRLSGLTPRGYRRIGIVWAGRPTHHNDRNRSMPLAGFAPLADIPDVALVSLQKGPSQTQIGGYWGRAPLIALGPEIRDFSDTMAIVEGLEQLVVVDTAVGHLAGAMGKPVSILLPYAPDWRWLLDRSDSPWYPSVRLYRQSADRQWAPVVARVARAVADGGSPK